MRQTTLGIILKDDKILLCMKKRGFGEGLWNGAGGKCENGETIQEAMIRELQEETGLKALDLEHFGVLHFYFKKDEKFNQDVNIFLIKDFTGEPVETEEMLPKWFNISDIPYDKMWADDIIWLPRVIAGEKIEYDLHFDIDGKIKEYKQII